MFLCFPRSLEGNKFIFSLSMMARNMAMWTQSHLELRRLHHRMTRKIPFCCTHSSRSVPASCKPTTSFRFFLILVLPPITIIWVEAQLAKCTLSWKLIKASRLWFQWRERCNLPLLWWSPQGLSRWRACRRGRGCCTAAVGRSWARRRAALFPFEKRHNERKNNIRTMLHS